jgi:protein phosphatase
LQIAGKSEKGFTREVNQDKFLFGTVDDCVTWIVVCDGMGGTDGGEVASRMAVDVVSESMKKLEDVKSWSSQDFKKVLLHIVKKANEIIYIKNQEDQVGSKKFYGEMGTTLVLVLVLNDEAVIVHVGDSRVYRIDAEEEIIEQITKDHSVVQELLDNGKIILSEVKYHPKKNIITRSLGVGEKVDLDVNFIRLDNKASLVICTDGITNYVSDNRILKIFKESLNKKEFVKKLVNFAKDAGSCDDMTVVAACRS